MKLQIQSYCNCGKSFLYPEQVMSDSKNLKELKQEEQIKSLIKIMKTCQACYKKDNFRIEAYDVLTEKNYTIYERKIKS